MGGMAPGSNGGWSWSPPVCAFLMAPLARAAEPPLKIVALGDSLTAGYGLPGDAAFPARLAEGAEAKGYDVTIVNAGVSGDTTTGGLDRLAWSVPDGTDGVILELGANDALARRRSQDDQGGAREDPRPAGQAPHPGAARRHAVAAQHGRRLREGFDAIYPALASSHEVVFYPFFLAGVATDAKLNQGDGMHPNAEGVDVIVRAHAAERRATDRPRQTGAPS